MSALHHRRRLFAFIAPEDTLGDPVLPLTLLVRAGPLFALLLLGVNDHYLKASGWLPGVITGKLSDFAGLVYFPLLLVTATNLIGFMLGKRRVRFASASHAQLVIACVATGLFFSAVQLSEGVAWFYARASAFLMFWNDAELVRVTMDPTDVVAILSLPVAYLLGRRGVMKVPPGRLAYALAKRGTRPSADVMADIVAIAPAKARHALTLLCDAVDEGRSAEELDQLLAAYRAQI